MDENKELWNKCVEFHGHASGGLTIGYKAALYAIERMGLRLGGGGNATTAGAQFPGKTTEDVLPLLKEAIDNYFDDEA